MSSAAALATYRQLLAKVDDKFEEIRSRHPTRFQCRSGCHGCCQPDLTVSPVERESIRAFLLAHPARREAAARLAEADPHQGRRCQFLTAEGACAIYEVRPVVCRSHGAPLKVKPQEGEARVERDVCPLNFDGLPLERLGEGDFIQLETLNTLLALINAQFEPVRSLARTRLVLEELLG